MIELAVKISEDSYKATCNGCMLPPDVENVVQGIKNGTLMSMYGESEYNSQKVQCIADKYGYSAQSMQLIEEMAELIQAINRRRRGKTMDLDEIKEEIADVEICLSQVKYLLRISDKELEEIKDKKIEREMERIGSR